VAANNKKATNMYIKYLTLAAVAVGLAGCAGERATGTFRSSASYDRLYAASLGAVPDIGYSVVSASKADGTIFGQQHVTLGEGSAVGLSASVTREAGGSVLRVKFIAPPNTFALGSFGQNVSDYVAAVRSRVPDVRPMAAAN
jgi:hypothetical protein